MSARRADGDPFNRVVLERLQALADPDGVILILRPQEIDRSENALQLSDDDIAVEQRLAEHARRRNSFAISFPASILTPELIWTPALTWIPSGAFDLFPTPVPSKIDEKRLQAAGMDASYVEELANLLQGEHLTDIRDRALGAIGGLLCHAGFRAETQTLRTLWRNIPAYARPRLPLGRIHVPVTNDEATDPLTSSLIGEFRARFLAFLDRWQLMEMSTWDFPNPLEFHPVDPRYDPNLRPATSVITSVSGLIPLNKSDRRISAPVSARHREFRRELNLEILENKWESYAQLARLRRLEMALQSRVRAHPSMSWPIPGLASLLGELMPCDEGHVHRLLRLTQNNLGGA